MKPGPTGYWALQSHWSKTAPAFMVVPMFGIKGSYNRVAAGCSVPLCVPSCGVSHSSSYLGCQHGEVQDSAQDSLKHTMLFHSLQCLWCCYSNYLKSIQELVTCRCSLFLTLWGLHAHELLASSFNYTSQGHSPTNLTKAIGAHRCLLTTAIIQNLNKHERIKHTHSALRPWTVAC